MKLVLIIIISVCVLLRVSKCHRTKRITFGTEAKPHSKPYQVHIIFLLRNGNGEICGGALVSKNYVLTAAHCFRNLGNIKGAVVILGAHKLTDEDKDYQITENFVIHKDFQQFPEGNTINDIALIKLNEPAKLSNNIQLIHLPTRSQVNESFTGIEAAVAGWGKTETHETSYVLLEGLSEITEGQEFCKFPKPMLCATGLKGAPCTGDSGSPLVFNNTVIGILSAGYCFIFSYYTRVTSFLDWIEKHSDVKIMN